MFRRVLAASDSRRQVMRYLYLIGFVLVLGLPFALRHALLKGDPAAPQSLSGAVRLVVVTPHNSDIRREFGRAFELWYGRRYGQRITIDFRMPGGTTDLVRLVTSTFDSYREHGKLPDTVPIDFQVIWGGGDYTYYHQLQPLGVLQPMHLNPQTLRDAFPHDALAGVRLYDATTSPSGAPTPQWVGVCLSSFGIIYNPELYQTLGLADPQGWAALADPRLFGMVALADPAHSGSAAVSYMMVIQRSMADAEQALMRDQPQLNQLSRDRLRKDPRYQEAIGAGWRRGMGQLLLIAANARYFSDSSEVVPTDVGRGEAAAGMSIDFYARVTEGTVGSARARFVAPRAATATAPDAVAIPRGITGERLLAAQRFVEFLLTREAQRLWILQPGQPGGPLERSPRRMPIRPDVYADQTGWADHFNPFDEVGGFNQRGEWMALMSDTLPVWIAAWIDSREALLDCYRTILDVKDTARREQLLTALAQVPVTMRDIENDRTERSRMVSAHADVDEWRARSRLQWGDRFRAHYRQIASQARSGI